MTEIRKTFTTPYEQYREREGQSFTVLRKITPETMTKADRREYFKEVLPMYKIRFADGFEASAWPDEVEI